MALTGAYISNSDGRDSHPSYLRRKRTAPSPVVHTPARPYAHLLLRVLDHPPHIPRLFSSTRSYLFPQRVLHSHPSFPLPHLSVAQPIHSRCCGARSQQTHGNGDVEEAGPSRHIVYLRIYAAICLRTLLQRTYIRLLTCSHDKFYLHVQLRLLSLNFSRVFQDAAVSRSELKRTIDVCETIRADSVQHRTTGTVLPFPRTGSRRVSRFLWLGSSSHGRFRYFACERVEDARRVINDVTFVSRLVLHSRFRHC